jgi:hypothetical protein
MMQLNVAVLMRLVFGQGSDAAKDGSQATYTRSLPTTTSEEKVVEELPVPENGVSLAFITIIRFEHL